MAKKTNNKNEFFEGLMEGLNDALAHSEGKLELRTTTIPKPLKQLSKAEIVHIRKSINVSQAVFAALLNISPRTVQKWEQGNGRPSGPSLKLLTIAKKNPRILVGT